jgi:hypothetical protein
MTQYTYRHASIFEKGVEEEGMTSKTTGKYFSGKSF